MKSLAVSPKHGEHRVVMDDKARAGMPIGTDRLKFKNVKRSQVNSHSLSDAERESVRGAWLAF